MAQSNNNNKLPNTDYQATYPWSQATVTLGGHEIIYNSTPGHESYRLSHPYGSFSEINQDGRFITLNADKKYAFTSNGHSSTIEGPRDELTIGGARENNQASVHKETGDNITDGVKGHALKAHGGTVFDYAKQSHERASEDDQISHHGPASKYQYYDGNNITFTTGTKYEYVKGEYGINLPEGNMDAQIASGKVRIKTGDNQLYDSDKKIDLKSESDTTATSAAQIILNAKTDITITSGTKITLVVGGSSIEITKGGIKIIGDSDGVNIRSDTGEIITKGIKTKIQNGGVSAPPTTFG